MQDAAHIAFHEMLAHRGPQAKSRCTYWLCSFLGKYSYSWGDSNGAKEAVYTCTDIWFDKTAGVLRKIYLVCLFAFRFNNPLRYTITI